MTTSEQQAVPVAQIDRDNYAEFGRMIARLTSRDADNVRAGEWDDTKDVQFFAQMRHRLAATSLHDMQITPSLALPCKSGEGANHGLGPHATVVDDCEDGFMSVAIVVGENVYLAQGGEQITMSREQFAEIAKTSTDATQTREAEGDTVKFVQEWMMSGDHEPNHWHRDFAAAIDARLPTEQVIFEAIKDECGTDRAARMMAAHIIAALNGRGGA